VDERIELDDVAVVAIVDKLIKQRKDSIAAFEQAARQDLADKEKAEMAVLLAFKPTTPPTLRGLLKVLAQILFTPIWTWHPEPIITDWCFKIFLLPTMVKPYLLRIATLC
jgi:hypothetical protein